MGQPILKGHHSEVPARKLQEKMHNNIRKGTEAGERANYWQERADALDKEPYAISSDDPEALEKLAARVETLQWRQAKMKLINVAYREFAKTGPGALEDFPELSDRAKVRIADWKPSRPSEKAPIPAYELTSVNEKIKAAKHRMEQIENMNNRPDRTYEINDIRIVENATENRIQMFFDGKPDEKTIAELKGNGFRWAHSLKCWQCQYSDSAIRRAKALAEAFTQ
jgi:hypothetical protein